MSCLKAKVPCFFGIRGSCGYPSTHEGSKSMIHLCTCTGGSASSFKNHTHPEVSKTCKSCGGKLSVDVRGALSGSMSSSLELQLAGLNWKTPSKGSPSNTRRTRTSRTGGNKKNILTKSLKESEDITDKEVKKTEDVPSSESEKLGVSILGRRFSETLGSVPLKKRRFPLFLSPSPPPKSSPHLDGSDQIQQRQSPSHEEEAASNAKHHHLNIGNEPHQNKTPGDEKSNLKDLNVKHCDVADFSGISILAAAACDNNIGGDIMNAKNSSSKEHSSKGGDFKCAESLWLHKERDDQIHKKDLDGTNDTLKLTVASGKASDGIKLDESSSHNSSGPSESDLDRTRKLGSSNNDKLSWDLNVVMDVWDSHNDAVLDSESQLASNIIGEAGFHDEKLGAAEIFQNQAVFGDKNYVLETANSRDLCDLHDGKCALEESKMEDRSDFSGGSSIPDEPERKDGNAMRQEKYELQNASVPKVDAIVLSRDSSVNVSALKKEKVDDCPASSRLLVEIELSTSLLSCENVSFDRTHCAIEQNSIMDNVIERVHDENRTAEPKAYLYDSLVHSSTTFVQNHAPSCTENDKADRCSVSNHVDETTSDVLVVSNSKNDLMDTSALSGESPQANVLNGIKHEFSDKLEEVCVAPLLPNPQPSQGLPDHEGSPCPGQYETTAEDNKCSMPFDGTLNSTRADPAVDVVSDIPACDSGPMKSCEVDAPSSDNALKSQGVVKGSADGYANSPGHITLDDHFDCDYYSDDSQLDSNQPMEKVDFLDDDEDQYEDGEWRESGLDTWGDNGSDEGEPERVDYGSDNRETDVLEPSIESPASVPLRVDRAEGMINADYDHKDRAQEDKETRDAASQSLQKCLLTTDVSDTGSPKRQVDGEIKTLERDATNASEPGAVSNKRHSWDQNAYRESSNLYNSRMKSSGWDRFPRDFSGSTKASFAGDSSRKVVSSSSMRDTPHTERPKSSDMKNREDKSYLRTTSSNNRNGLNPRLARDAGAPTSIGRDRSSLLVRGRGRNDRWVDSSNRDGHTSLDSPGYCRPVGFTPPASRNAAAVTVAKLESNGFIVAPDGTIVKAGIMGPVRQAPQLPTKPPHHSLMGKGSSSARDGAYSTQLGLDISRETGSGSYINIGRDRACRYGPETANIVYKERYHRPISDESIETSSPLHHRSARREQCLSPHRRPIRRSRSRSLSRSRTRSPHMYGSPRGRNGGPGLHPRSRSPNFKPEDSIVHRPRSPHHRSGILKGTVGCAQLSRNHTSPPNDSRWFDGRKDLPVQFREHEQHRFSERSPPRRVLSQRHRLDPVDSAGRMKPNMFSRSMHPGNFAEFVGPDRRRSRFNDDRRGYNDRIEVQNSERQNDIDGNMKQRLRYDDAEDGYVAHYPRPRSSEFQRRGGSPRGFDRLGVNQQLEGSPRRAKEEKGHGRFVKEGKQDSGGFDSFGVRNYNDETIPRRRPS